MKVFELLIYSNYQSMNTRIKNKISYRNIIIDDMYVLMYVCIYHEYIISTLTTKKKKKKEKRYSTELE